MEGFDGASVTSVNATAVGVAPTIIGAQAHETVTDQGAIAPFGTISVADSNFGQTETLSVTLSSAANGTLTNLGLDRDVETFLKSGIFQRRLKDKEKIVNDWTEIKSGL